MSKNFPGYFFGFLFPRKFLEFFDFIYFDGLFQKKFFRNFFSKNLDISF